MPGGRATVKDGSAAPAGSVMDISPMVGHIRGGGAKGAPEMCSQYLATLRGGSAAKHRPQRECSRGGARATCPGGRRQHPVAPRRARYFSRVQPRSIPGLGCGTGAARHRVVCARWLRARPRAWLTASQGALVQRHRGARGSKEVGLPRGHHLAQGPRPSQSG